MSVRDTVVTVFTDVAKQQDKPIVLLTDQVSLLDLGLDSLCMAIIVARLEGVLGIDPFSAADEVPIPTTFGDFVALYEHPVG
jgi:acyl carrier protein